VAAVDKGRMSWIETEKNRWVREVGADGARVELLLAGGEAFAFLIAGDELRELELEDLATGQVSVEALEEAARAART
jgi:hypothetical protein